MDRSESHRPATRNSVARSVSESDSRRPAPRRSYRLPAQFDWRPRANDVRVFNSELQQRLRVGRFARRIDHVAESLLETALNYPIENVRFRGAHQGPLQRLIGIS